MSGVRRGLAALAAAVALVTGSALAETRGVGPSTAAPEALPGQTNVPLSQARATLDALEARADAVLARGDLAAYRDALRDAIVLALKTPGLDPVRRARAQRKLANYLHDYESDFVSARLLATGALEVFRARLGEGARETLQQRADLIYFRLQQAEMSELQQRAGIAPQFGTGDPAIDGQVTEDDLAVFRALHAVVEREEPDESVRLATWSNYISMLNKAGRYDEAISAALPRMRDLDARSRRGEAIPPDVRFHTLRTLLDTFVAGRRYDWALQLYVNGMDDALHYLRTAIFQKGVDRVGAERLHMRLFAEGFIHLAWRVARSQSAEMQGDLRALAFEAAQMAGFNPAASAVARQGFRGAMTDPALRADLARWSQLSPFVSGQVAERRSLSQLIEAAHPGFMTALVPDPVAMGRIAGGQGGALLQDDEALILILNMLSAPGGNGVVIALTREGSAWAEIPLGWEDLSFHILSLHYHLDPREGVAASLRAPQSPGASRTAPGTAPFDFKAAGALYQAFFGAPEIAALIAEKPNWTIVPHGEVLGLPFAALVVEDGGEGERRSAEALRAVRWLGQERALSVLPSVAAFDSLRTRPATPAAERVAYVGLGDPDFQGAAGAPLRSADAVARAGENRAAMIRALPRLPGTRREVETLSRLFGDARQAVRLGPDASEQDLAGLAADGILARADVVHFATHGLLAGAFEGLSEPALALSPPRPGTAGGDGLLTASEAARLPLSADWVILSACDTAGEDSINGDGLGGLVQGFFAAGAANLLVSHWRVDDSAAERLITGTVGAHRAGTGKAEALRRTMQQLAGDRSRDGSSLPNSHPSVWAPFVLVGGG